MFSSKWFAGLMHDARRTLSLKRLEDWEENHGSEKMSRTLTFPILLALVVANVIGAGVFVMTGDAANQYAGPAVMISYLLAGIVAIYAAKCYAEQAADVSGAGSAVTYAYVSLGEFVAVMIGWDLFCECSIGSAAVASGWGDNMTALLRRFGYDLPTYLSKTPEAVAWLPLLLTMAGSVLAIVMLRKFLQAPSLQRSWLAALALMSGAVTLIAGIDFFSTLPSVNLPAAFVTYFVTAVLLLGASEAAWATTVLTVLKVLVLAVFVALGFGHFDSSNMQPFMPFGFSGVLHGASIVFFAFVGFESVTTSAAECKNPQRDIPRAIMWGNGICTVIYMVVSTVLVGAVSYKLLGGTEAAAPMAKAMELLGYRWGFTFIALGSCISLLSVLMVSQYGLSRLARSMSTFGLLPPFLGTLNRRKVPYWSILIFGQIVATAAALLPVDELAHLCNIGTLAAFIVVCLATAGKRLAKQGATKLSLWQKAKLLHAPLMGIIGCVVLIAFLPATAWIRFTLWMIPGAMLWAFRGRFKSRLTTDSSSPAKSE